MGRPRTVPVQLRELPPHRVAYMRYVGPYGAHGIPELWTRFNRWMETRGLMTEARLTLACDDPRTTAAEQCRDDACGVVSPEFVPDRRVTGTEVPGGRHAVAEFVGTAGEIEAALGPRLRGVAARKRMAARRPPLHGGVSRRPDRERPGRNLPLPALSTLRPL